MKSPKIAIVNYSIGNVGSVYSALKFYNYNVDLAATPEILRSADMLVLAGVGNYPAAISKLKELSLWEVMNELVITKKKPVLGICLGMQLFADIGYENGENKGFGWIPGKVVKMEGKDLKIPHIGWNEIMPRHAELFKNSRYNFFYFMHSYHFVPDDDSAVIATTRYGGLEICSAVRKDNIIGMQFHPEKSQGDGLRLLRSAVESLCK
jgi:glutamine amidotransferase